MRPLRAFEETAANRKTQEAHTKFKYVKYYGEEAHGAECQMPDLPWARRPDHRHPRKKRPRPGQSGVRQKRTP